MDPALMPQYSEASIFMRADAAGGVAGHAIHSGFIAVSGVLRLQTSRCRTQKPTASDYAAS